MSVGLGVAVALLAAGCGGGGGKDSESKGPTTSTTTATSLDETTTTLQSAGGTDTTLGFDTSTTLDAGTTAPTAARNVTTTTARKAPTTTVKKGGSSTRITVEGGAGNGSAKDVDPNGVLKVGIGFPSTGNGAHFDPNQSSIITDLTWMQLVYGTLLRETPDGQYEPWMAKSVDLIDSKTIKLGIRTNPPLRFTDGWPYDAQAVADGLMRTRFQPATVSVQAGMHSAFRSMQTAKATDPGTVIITLKDPIAGDFLTSLANREGSIVSPKQVSQSPNTIDTAPIGAGPYTVAKYDPTSIMQFKRNPDFFEASSFRIPEIDIVNTPTGPAGVNGLLSGSIDYYGTVPADSAAKVQSDSRYLTATGFTEFAYQMIIGCTTKPPFDNEDFRRGLQEAIDKDQVNKLVYNGLGRPAYGLWPEGHVNFNPAVKQYTSYNPTEAKAFFAKAGITPDKPLTVELYNAAPVGQERADEVLQALLDPYGIKVHWNTPANIITGFIQPQLPGGMWVPGSRTGYDKYGRVWLPDAQQTLCGMPRSDVMSPVRDAASYLPSDPRAIASYKAAELAVVQHGYAAPIVQAPTIIAWNKSRVGDTPAYSASRALLDWRSIYVRK